MGSAFVNILGSIGLLVWGVRMVRTGVSRAFGYNLRKWLAIGTRNRGTAFLTGLFTTVVTQSSTATALLTASFAGKNLISTTMAQAVMLGSNVGTSLVAYLLNLEVQWLSPILIVGGVSTFMLAEAAAVRATARAIVGLGLMLLAIKLLVEAAGPARESGVLLAIVPQLAQSPLLATVVGATFAVLASSSLAVVLLVSSLNMPGATPLATVALVIGANIGAAIAPMVVTMRMNPKEFRIAVGNFVVRLLGGVVVVLVMYVGASQASAWIISISSIAKINSHLAVYSHVAFNVGLALIFLPLVGYLASCTERVFPDLKKADNGPKYLDSPSFESPAIALAGAMRESLRIVDLIESMLLQACEAQNANDEQLCDRISKIDNQVDRLQEATKHFLVRLQREVLDPEDAIRSVEVMSFAINLEHIGDIIDRSLLMAIRKKARQHLSFSPEGKNEIDSMFAQTFENLRIAQSVFVSRDLGLARRLIQAKTEIRKAEQLSSAKHLQRLTADRLDSVQTSAVHLDILRDLKRINSHIAAIAYSMLDRAGLLDENRLKKSTG